MANDKPITPQATEASNDSHQRTDIDNATLEKLKLEAKELRLRIESHESKKVRLLKLLVSIGTPILTAVLIAAHVELRSVRKEREKLQIEQAELQQKQKATVDQILLRNLKSHQLTHKDPQVRLDAVKRIRDYPPEIAQEASQTLVRLLRSAQPDDDIDPILTTLARIGTPLVVSDLLEFVKTSQLYKAIKALDTVAKIGATGVFEGLRDLMGTNDPMLAGRAKGYLVSLFRDRTIAEAKRVASTENVQAANDYLDALTIIEGPDVDSAIAEFISFPGHPSSFVGEMNPRERALWLLFGKDTTAFRDKTHATAISNISSSRERCAAAANLLGTEYHELARTILLTQTDVHDFDSPDFSCGYAKIGERLLMNPKSRKTGVEMLFQFLSKVEEFNSRPPISYWNWLGISDELPRDALHSLLNSTSGMTTLYVAVASLLMPHEPDFVIKSLDEKKVSGLDRAIILSRSPKSLHKQEAFQIWLKEVAALPKLPVIFSDLLSEFYNLQIPVADRDTPAMLKLLDELAEVRKALKAKYTPDLLEQLDSKLIMVEHAVCHALIGTDAEARAEVAMRLFGEGGVHLKFLYLQWLKAAGRDDALKTEVSQILKDLDNPNTEVTKKVDDVSKLASLGYGPAMQNDTLGAYLDLIVRAEDYNNIFKSKLSFDAISLIEVLYPEAIGKWERSVQCSHWYTGREQIIFGEWRHCQWTRSQGICYSSLYAELLIAMWVSQRTFAPNKKIDRDR